MKPDHLLLDPNTHIVKLCGFGNAKKLNDTEPNTTNVGSPYYRAPELMFENQFYTTSIDLWSIGCIIAELFLCRPIFYIDINVDCYQPVNQLVEVIKHLGTPTKQEIKAMNPEYEHTDLPPVKGIPFETIFAGTSYNGDGVPKDAIDLMSKFLVYTPLDRIKACDALKHPFFDQLRDKSTKLPNGNQLPPLPNVTTNDLNLQN